MDKPIEQLETKLSNRYFVFKIKNMVKGFKFDTWLDMYRKLALTDLYSPTLGTYAFYYDWHGAIATYEISEEDAVRLAYMARKQGDYWSAFLGPAERIYTDPDDNIHPPHPGLSNKDFCKRAFKERWIKTTDVPLYYNVKEFETR